MWYRIENNVIVGGPFDCDQGRDDVLEFSEDHADVLAFKAKLASPAIQVPIQIAAIELSQPVTQRALRELILVIGQAYPQVQSTPFYQRAAAQEAQVRVLRALL